MRQAYAELAAFQVEYGLEAFDNVESVRRTMRGFKIANAELRKQIFGVMKRIADLEARRAKIPSRVPVNRAVDDEIVELAVERKHLTDLLKMVAYQAEGDLLRMIAPDYCRANDEGRTLVQNALATGGDIEVADNELRVSFDPLSSPHRTHVLAALCEQLNETLTCFPGTKLRLCFAMKPEPPPSLAFPGPRPVADAAAADAQPDISTRGRSGGLESERVRTLAGRPGCVN